jgi:hypothetical protein
MSAVPVDEAPQLLSLTDALWTARVLEATAALALLDQLSSSPKGRERTRNICHLFDEERNRALLHRLRPTVKPSGLLAIIDVLTQADLAAQRWISLYAFFLRLRTCQGAVHPLAAYETWTATRDSVRCR